jgi:hypothetical protein
MLKAQPKSKLQLAGIPKMQLLYLRHRSAYREFIEAAQRKISSLI